MEFLTVSETARRLMCSTAHVYRLLAKKYIVEFRQGRKHFVVKKSLDEFIDRYCRDGNIPTMSYIELVDAHPELYEIDSS